MSGVAALILAAGAASRFRAAAGADAPASKLIADFAGKPLVRHVAEAALASKADPVIVVTGHAGSEVERALDGLAVTVLHNPNYAQGMSTSLKSGIAALPGDCAGAFVLLGDMPLIGAHLLDEMIARFSAEPGVDALVPLYRGVRGNPVLLAASLFSSVAGISGDRGARGLIEREGVRVLEFPVEDGSVSLDVDTPEALASLGRGS